MSNGLMTTEQQQTTMAIATTRQAQEVQAAMIVAKQYPRDELAAMTRLVKACKRTGLAECSMYSYPKGKQVVTGASIRLAEAMAQSWGNIDYGLIELEQKNGESSVMAYAWDLETNTRRQMVFQVRHVRSKRDGNVLLTDPRDIYELVANQGARRVRSCILGVIPGDVQDLAVAECEKTLATGSGKSLDERIRDMVIAFGDLQITKDMLEARLQHPVTACTAVNIVAMQKIYLSIRDGVSKREDWFELAPVADKTEAAGKSRTEQAAAKMQKPKAEPTEEVKLEAAKVDETPAVDTSEAAIAAARTVEQLDAIMTALKASKEALGLDQFDFLYNVAKSKRKAIVGK